MKILFALLICAPAWAVDTVDHIDIHRYLGTWNEIASIPQSFQKNCYKNTQAEYDLLEDGFIKVINSCETKEGDIDSAPLDISNQYANIE